MRLAAQKRSTKADLAEMYERLAEIVRDQTPCTIRQVFYRATVAGLGPKEEQFYGRVDRYLLHMRSEGIISYSDIADNTRWMRKPTTHNSLARMLLRSRAL